ncbi:hypothetical protein JCM11641_005898 [Rhodosporidiobolus odoratus]
MPTISLERTMGKRDLAVDAGQSIKDWIDKCVSSIPSPPVTSARLLVSMGQSSSAVFGMTVAFAFLLAFIIITIAWEIARKCRNSIRSHDQERWHRLGDGSSVRISGAGSGPGFLGPMASLIRDGRAEQSNEGYGYTQTRGGDHGRDANDMRADANLMSGRFGAYDPPVAPGPERYQLSDAPVQRYPPPQAVPSPVPRPSTVDSTWSGDTRIGTADLGKKDDDLKSTAPGIGKDETNLFLPPPPPAPQGVPSIVSAPRASTLQQPPGHGYVPSISRSLRSDASSLPLPNSARTSTVLATGGEAAFSNPKPTAVPLPPSPSPGLHTRTASVPYTPPHVSHTRTPSTGFTPKPLGLAKSLSSSSVTSAEPPKVDLKRNWSIGTWIPTYSKGKEEEGESVSLVARSEGQ